MVDTSKTWALVVVWAGSGGIGAALAGARLGLRVLLDWPAPAGYGHVSVNDFHRN